ncbi:hypothetical protein, partial [uncultured Alistipes sp.]|uniref:hypothetical protein n=1 Tax=uncultured Alistipes sp. TaxID=538949 RepID=UPI0032201657
PPSIYPSFFSFTPSAAAILAATLGFSAMTNLCEVNKNSSFHFPVFFFSVSFLIQYPTQGGSRL